MELKIRYFSDSIDRLAYIAGKSDWIDLRAAEEVRMKAGEFRLIPLGVAIALPKGYEAHVVPRSSTFKNFGILQTNSMGVIDASWATANGVYPVFTFKNGAAMAEFDSLAVHSDARKDYAWERRTMTKRLLSNRLQPLGELHACERLATKERFVSNL